MFYGCKKALQSPTTISIPRPSDSPVLTVDASSVISGLVGTFIIQHDTGHHVAGFFSFKLMEHQRNWLPCEFEVLTIAAFVNYFVPYICESHRLRQILFESKPCVEAYKTLFKGHFSAPSWICTFLSTLSLFNVPLHTLSCLQKFCNVLLKSNSLAFSPT